MLNQWNEGEAPDQRDELGQFAYMEGLLAQEQWAVGLRSISFKRALKNLAGKSEEILFVNACNQDWATFEVGQLIALRLQPLSDLLQADAITDAQLANELACQRIHCSDLFPSKDALIHAILPAPYVVWTEPLALLAINSTFDALNHLRRIFGDTIAIVSENQSGFLLAKAISMAHRAAPSSIIGLVTLDGGLIAFGETPRVVYNNLVDLITRAECYLWDQRAWEIALPQIPFSPTNRVDIAALRQAVSEAVGHPVILTKFDDPLCIAFAQRDDIANLISSGCIVGQSIKDSAHVIVDPKVGLYTFGDSAKEATMIGEWYRRRIEALWRASMLGRLKPLSTPNLTTTCELKLPMFAGEIALVTGAASGIGKACVESLLARGAAVIGLDISPKIVDVSHSRSYLGLVCDVTDEEAIENSFDAAVKTFGGLDMVVLNAGIFPPSTPIAELELAMWQKVMQVNLNANVSILRRAYPLLKRAPRGGRVVVNASKNVLAPGTGAAAYSASKAALTQLARVAALEWGKDKIRVNIIHPDAVFDTGIWTEEVLKARAAHYGMTVQQYKTRNVLGVEINSHYVAELIAEMLGPLFEKITGAQIPVDGGSDRVI